MQRREKEEMRSRRIEREEGRETEGHTLMEVMYFSSSLVGEDHTKAANRCKP